MVAQGYTTEGDRIACGLESTFAMDTQSGNISIEGIAARAALESFIVENNDLLMLESRIGKFNIFDALRITRKEIRQSNFLAFILDPAESHGQGQLFLKALLMDLLKQAPPDRRPLSPLELDGTDLRGIEIKREWKYIDLLITCKELRFAVVFENKIDTQEHSNQLLRAQWTMTDYYPDLRPLYIYLTPGGDKPSEESWLPYTYADIHRVLQRARNLYQNAIGDDVLVFLDHYLNLLGTRFMNDEKLDELCRRIYKNHRQALDLIWERVGSTKSAALTETADVLEQDPRWHISYRSGKLLDFVPKNWREWLPLFRVGDDPQAWIFVEFASSERALTHAVYVTPLKDASKYEEIVTKLRKEATSFGLKRTQASGIGTQFARITVAERFLEWGEDEEPEPEAIREAAKKTLNDLYPKLEKMALVLKPLCIPPAVPITKS
jgi:hypothetical protein